MRTCTNAELEKFPQLDWLDLAPRMQPEIRSAVERALEFQDGSRLTRDECLLLANAEADDLLGLCKAPGP